jgi:Na+-transporting NADH:ubiquinone oxidoreductase subunit D
VVLIAVATIRELFGSGTLLGFPILPTVADGGWFYPMGLMVLPPAAFFLIGFFIWGLRTWKTAQVEQPEYRIHVAHRAEVM